MLTSADFCKQFASEVPARTLRQCAQRLQQNSRDQIMRLRQENTELKSMLMLFPEEDRHLAIEGQPNAVRHVANRASHPPEHAATDPPEEPAEPPTGSETRRPFTWE